MSHLDHTDDDRDAAEPVALYEGPRFTSFRGFTLIFLVAGAVAAGASSHAAFGWARERWQAAHAVGVVIVEVPPVPPPPPPSTATVTPTAHITWPMTLPGPNGTSVTLSG